MEWKLGDRARVYLNSAGEPVNKKDFPLTSFPSVDAEIIAIGKEVPLQDVFLASKDFDSNFGIKVHLGCQATWEDSSGNYKCISEVSKYFGMQGGWVSVRDLYEIDSPNSSPKKSVEKSCQICQRPNYEDVKECWCCGNKPW